MGRQQIEEHIRNFHLQWDHFPFAAMLIRKDRTILAANSAALESGIAEGIRCCDLGKKEAHQACLANCALQEKSAKRLTGYSADYGMVLDSYWVPVVGEDDLYLHFSIDITEYAAPRMFPADAPQSKS